MVLASPAAPSDDQDQSLSPGRRGKRADISQHVSGIHGAFDLCQARLVWPKGSGRQLGIPQVRAEVSTVRSATHGKQALGEIIHPAHSFSRCLGVILIPGPHARDDAGELPLPASKRRRLWVKAVH
jgi:hypothetical protein